LILCFGLLMVAAGLTARLAAAEGDGAENTAEPVKAVKIDYDELWLEVDAGDNETVYYSDKAKKVWSEALKGADGKYIIDISWLKATSATEITLNGDKNEEVATVKLPARESKYKIKFDKAKGVLTFSGLPSDVTDIQWRKATSYEWKTVSVEDAKDPESDFAEEIEKLRIAGASIYVRTMGVNPEADSDGTLDTGSRPGKEVKLSISKFAAAPKVKVDGKKLTLNTTNSMEYSTDNVNWTPATKTMALKDIAPEALGASAKDVVLYFRKKATSKAPHSKTFVLEIPAQRPAPTSAEVTHKSEGNKYLLTFSQASKTTPYEYAVVKNGNTFDEAKASWKAVMTAKTISLS
ncbi:MAG: hypothetical protein K2O03_05090, partial [Lachnospiraceae bacterium]|nr:hypothetical protein [Lachnospiraceae bacterium]